MTAELVTQSTTITGVRTPSQPNDTTETWLKRHVDQIGEAIADGDIDMSTVNEICTNWPTSSSPPPSQRCNNRLTTPPGETDEEFLDRHFEDVAKQMASNPPIP